MLQAGISLYNVVVLLYYITLYCHRMSGFAGSDFAPVLQTLVEAYKEKDEESFFKCCDDSIFRTMDNEVCLYWMHATVYI